MKNKFVLTLISLAVFLGMGCQPRYYLISSSPPRGYRFIDYAAKIDSLKREIEADSSNPESYILLGKAYVCKKQYEDACEQTEKALSLSPDKIDTLKNDPTFSYWAIFFNASYKHFENKYFYLAIERLQRSLDFDPKSAVSMNLLAQCYEESKRDDKAEKTYKKAIELDTDYVETYINLADFYTKRTKFEKAEKILRVAEEIVENPRWLQPENEYVEQRIKAKAKVHLELGKLLLQYKTKKESNSDNNK